MLNRIIKILKNMLFSKNKCNCPSCQRVRWIGEAYEKGGQSKPTANDERLLKEIWNANDGRSEYYETL